LVLATLTQGSGRRLQLSRQRGYSHRSRHFGALHFRPDKTSMPAQTAVYQAVKLRPIGGLADAARAARVPGAAVLSLLLNPLLLHPLLEMPSA
jgi:hypothetical protein